MGLGCDAGAVCDQQVHHIVASDINRGGRHHIAKGDRGAGPPTRRDRARCTLAAVVGAHMALELGGSLAVDPAQLTHQDAPCGGGSKAPSTVFPLLAMMLLSVDTQVSQGGEAAITKMAGVVLRLVVHPHMICNVSR